MVKGKEVSEDAPQVGSLFMVLDAVGIHISWYASGDREKGEASTDHTDRVGGLGNGRWRLTRWRIW